MRTRPSAPDVSAALAGRTALVTGASRGIGLAIARRLVGAGARTAMLARTTELLRSSASALGDDALAIACDVTDSLSVGAAVDAVSQEFGSVPDIVVNAAGQFSLAAVEHTTLEAFQGAIQANLVGPFLIARATVPALRSRGSGHFVSIGSVADRSVFPGNAAYAASKFGARALHEVLRTELRGSGVRVSLVSPGPTDTALWDSIDPDHKPGFLPRAAMLRTETVADAVLYVLSQPVNVNVDELRLSPA